VLHRPESPNLLRLALQEIADRRAVRHLRSFRPQVIYAWGVSQLFASLWRALHDLGVPIVHNVQDTHVPRQIESAEARWAAWHKPGAGRLRRVAKRTLLFGLSRLDPDALRPLGLQEADLSHLIFCSEFIRCFHARADLAIGDHRVIYNGVDRKIFFPQPVRETGRPLRLLFVGRLHSEKGLHVALDALERLEADGCDSIRLDIYGLPAYPAGYERAQRQKAQGFGDRATFHTAVTGAQLASVYRAHDVLLFPSSRAEGLPMALCEAMACGLPAISTTSGGSGELAKDGVSALVVPPEDGAALAAAIARVDADRPLLARLAAGAETVARDVCDLDTVVQQTERYLEQVAAASVARTGSK
jgi:glycosyltransferase involved in cell wall biosynthesis